jgi:hypothetical protein
MIDLRHHCVVCRQSVTGPSDGVLFGALGRPLFVTCLAHAPVVRAGAATAVATALAGLNTLIDRKLPTLGKVIREVRTVRDKELT